MLTLKLDGSEFYDHKKEEFVTIKPTTITLEHSLVSIAKWESKWEKPFLNDDQKTDEQIIDYIRCMTITQNVNDDIYDTIPIETMNSISDYIDKPMTATIFNNGLKRQTGPKKREIITNEIIYYWMIALNIPMECQKWHLNRLLTLIKVCNIKNGKPEKMSRHEVMAQNKTLNEQRQAMFNTKG